MLVEIWSDVMCPFCYIGKRNFEAALAQLDNKTQVKIEWKSFQLDPEMPLKTDQETDVYTYLSERKGISRKQVEQMHIQVTQMAANAGLDYHLESTVMVNSFKAHRLIQFAKTKGLGDAAEEKLFYANFTEGKDFGDDHVLQAIGKEIGLQEADVTAALTDDQYAYAAKSDINEAMELGINGVPFFVFDRKYAISGAQPPAAFLQALQQLEKGNH